MMGEEFLFDKRIVEMNMRLGLIDREAYEKHLKKLKDLSAQAEPCTTEMVRVRKRLPTRVLEEEEL
ncbi:MAG: hypothetical protein D6806_18035 [Deltaproteobacteria bacterium]|nr:MAG: hypothetical protein D6806_18035 [Deltaproteobacteria bacterium]